MWPANIKMPRILSVLLGLVLLVASVIPDTSNTTERAILPLVAGLIIGGASLLSGIFKSNAASDAAQAQAQAATAGITAVKEGTSSGLHAQDVATKQGITAAQSGLTEMQAALAPYMNSGAKAVASQDDLAGLNGPDAQKAAVAAISGGSEMDALVTSGEDAMRQNATATGGLRGGNFQGAIAQFRPKMLSDLISQQYARLGGLSSLGQASASTYGTGAVQTGGTIASLYGTQGAGAASLYSQQGQDIAQLAAAKGNAQAADAIASGSLLSSFPSALGTGLGVAMGAGA
jgi:hypothetical protein